MSDFLPVVRQTLEDPRPANTGQDEAAPVAPAGGKVVPLDCTSLPEAGGARPETDFIKLEKNLASLGFFTPANKNNKRPVAKTIQFTRLVGGKRVTASVSIAPSVLTTLPTTADQDKYIAFQKILMDRRQEGEEIQNPVGFTSKEMLRVLGGHTDAGKNYQDIARWLQVMTATTIVSEGAVYFAGTRAWATDTFHVFDRAVSVGRELPDGRAADRNYVWLSEWQLRNINVNYLLPIDFEAYRSLRNHIAKALVPLLQIWLFASERTGTFEKRYDELCQHLHISQYRYLSKIHEKLAPALDELVAHGYLTSWDVARAADGQSYKVIFAHGTKYFEDKARRSAGAAPVGPQEAYRGRLRPGGPPNPPAQPHEPPRAAPPGSGMLCISSPEVLAPSRARAEAPQVTASWDDALAEEVCRHFHETLYRTGGQARLFLAELREAAELVGRYGAERSKYVADYFMREVAPRTQFRPVTICGLRPHVAPAVLDYDARLRGGGPPAAPNQAALASARQRHIRVHQAAYDAYRRKAFARLRVTQSEAMCTFQKHDAAQRDQEAEGMPKDLRAVTLRRFDRDERQLDRAWKFFAQRKDWGIVSFWEWDELHNPERLIPRDVPQS